MQNIDSCLTNLKDYYLKSNDKDKESIIKIIQKVVNIAENNTIDDLAFGLEKVDKITNLANRGALLCDISMVEGEAMLMFLHVNQIAALKELHGIDIAKEIIIDKSKTLKKIVSDSGVSIYNINLQKFAILITEKSLFDKYLSVLKYSIFNNQDNDFFELENGDSIMADFTVGIAYGKEYLFHQANVALQEALLSKQCYKIFKTCSNTKDLKRLSLDKLKVYKSALYQGNIIPYFQPIVDAKDGSIMKYEALARLKTESGKILSPYEFLNSAVEDKTFEFFTRQMMQKVFDIYAKTDIEISMNLTYDNISSPSTMDYIKNRLDKYGGNRMTFEILETEEIKDYDLVDEFILLVKKYGAKVSIDDFGSGYSNFTNIIKLNIDYIKIDGTLITKLHDDQKVKNMVQGLIQFSKSIDVKTIAEFVSSKAISDEIIGLGVDYLQGYYYGKPKPAKEYGLV